MEPLEIRNLFLMKEFYMAVVVAAVCFVFLFAKSYDDRGIHLDWSVMFWRIVGNIAKFFISFVLVMSFISMISIF
jgi:hypothetical protein